MGCIAKVFLLHISQAELIGEDYCAEYFPERLSRAKKFRKRSDYLRCIGAGALIHSVLDIREENIRFGEYGKPFAYNCNKKFCISHSGEYTVLAVDDNDIGVDIENICSANLSAAKRVFTDEERKWQSEDNLNRFYTLWTLKEAVMKQCGRGFNLPPESFSVMPLIREDSINIDGALLYGKSIFYDSHAVSICTVRPISDIDVSIMTYKDIK